MYLKSLVLKGFKSFADRSVLALEPGITAVVGPNGSGKSNISDAVLWVLGERNAKHLRGQAMEDVIFAGSSARKATGLAEVDLVLDNTDGTLPVDFSEVAITRRMYRSGESEYLINGTPARRMDVLDILHDSGLGTGTHSIISQGSLDSILQSKPEDRRALIEEAAGVLKHKQRKAKSERKLEQMDQHLLRVRDVVAEVSRQLGPLERKAKKAHAYQELSSELSDLSLLLAVDDLRVLQRKWDDACARESGLAEELECARQAIARTEAHVGELQEKIRLESVGASELSKRHRLASAAADHIDSAAMVMRERRRAGRDRAGEFAASLEANKTKADSARAELASLEEQLAAVRTECEQADARVASLAARSDALARERSTLEREAGQAGRALDKTKAELDAARREQAREQEALSSGVAHMKLIEGHGKELELQLARVRQTAEELSRKTAAANEELARIEVSEADARTRMGDALQACEQARAARDEARDAEHAVAGEIAGLEEVERASAAAAGSALSWLLEHGAEVDAGLAPLSHVVRSSHEREALVEHLLGTDVAALLVSDSASACQVALALADGGLEGAVSLVMRKDASAAACAARADAAPSVGFATCASKGANANANANANEPANEPQSEKGARPACAAQLAFDAKALPDGCFPLVADLSFPPDAARAVCALLGDVVVCDTLDIALDAHVRDRFSLRFATLGGIVVWPSGKITLGKAAAADEEGALSRARRLKEARARHEAAARLSQSTVAAVVAAEETLRAAQAASLDLGQKLAQKRGEVEAARAEEAHEAEKLASVRRELEDVSNQRTAAQEAVKKARPNVDAYAAKVDELTSSLAETKKKLDRARASLAPLRDAAARVAEDLSAAKLSAATLAERETYVCRMRDSRALEIERLDASNRAAKDSLRKKHLSVERIEPLLALFDELAVSARRWVSELEDQAFSAQHLTSGLHDKANEARDAAKCAQEAFDGVSERISAVRVEKGRLEVQVQTAVQVIVSENGTPLETALALPELEDRADVEGKVFKLRRRIANMGAVNPDAAREYDALKVRYDYLAAQLSDLDNARRALAKINRVIDVRMKDDFVRTYEAVDKNFQEIFSVLFPGGSAHLSLVDPDDVENTGVEVSAQPRGKRITKMMLMSGGEKSLTALALLFAVYRIRATPFYILDEVEAALDDTNLRRLVSYIQTLRDHTQLIMITHQRRTMEMADVLFGVSMQADGVTKVISQKLDRALEYAQ